MKTLQIEESKAKELYKTASAEFKIMLEDSFGKEFFENDWMELWNKFCKDYKLNLTLPYPSPSNPDEEYIDAQFMMMHIIRKKRKKKPDFMDDNQYKYAPYFYFKKDKSCSSGFALDCSYSYHWDASTTVGSRLCIPDNKSLIDELAVEFLKIYEKIIIEP